MGKEERIFKAPSVQALVWASGKYWRVSSFETNHWSEGLDPKCAMDEFMRRLADIHGRKVLCAVRVSDGRPLTFIKTERIRDGGRALPFESVDFYCFNFHYYAIKKELGKDE